MRPRLLLPLLTVVFVLATAQTALAQDGEGDPTRGGELFVANCAVCHGVDGQGRVGASLDAFPGIEPGPALEAVIAAGVTGSVMPAWAEANGGPLSAQDIRDIAAYIVAAFGGTEPITPLPTYVAPAIPALPDIEGDPAGGAVVYQANCVMCHGERGEGRFGATLAKAWPSSEPDTYLQQVVRQGIAGSIMPAWAQANGGPLADAEIADVAAFVLTLEPAPVPTPIPEPTPPVSASMTLILFGLLAVAGIVVLVFYYRRANPE
jgi:mono/diheme cytochrome c family protein